jgi:hypothetical protein
MGAGRTDTGCWSLDTGKRMILIEPVPTVLTCRGNEFSPNNGLGISITYRYYGYLLWFLAVALYME